MKSMLQKVLYFSFLIVLSTIFFIGCGGKVEQAGSSGNTSSADEQTIQVLVPCGQMGPFYDAKPLFEKANPDVKIEPIVENISVLTQKILDGKESPEVFMSMGDYELTMLEEKGRLLEGTRTAYAPNSLALIVSRKNPAKVKSLKDIANPAVKTFAMVKPEISSAGFHAKEAMEKLGVWESCTKKALNPEQPEMVAQAVGKGDAQAGIAYWPCMTEVHTPGAKPMPRKKVMVIEAVPQNLYTPFSCEAAVIQGAKNPELGKKFIEFLKSPEVQTIYTKWNFIAPKPEPIEGQKTFDVILTSFGKSEIITIKVVRELTGLGLADAKKLVESAPKPVLTGVSKEDAVRAKAKLEEAGAKAEIK